MSNYQKAEQPNQDMVHVKIASQKRQGSQRRQAEKERTALFTRLQDDLTALDRPHAADLSALRAEYLTQLHTLVAEKSSIEKSIHESNGRLQRAYRSAIQEIRCAVDGRIADLTPREH